jgi:hypothetical protein
MYAAKLSASARVDSAKGMLEDARKELALSMRPVAEALIQETERELLRMWSPFGVRTVSIELVTHEHTAPEWYSALVAHGVLDWEQEWMDKENEVEGTPGEEPDVSLEDLWDCMIQSGCRIMLRGHADAFVVGNVEHRDVGWCLDGWGDEDKQDALQDVVWGTNDMFCNDIPSAIEKRVEARFVSADA